MAAILDGERPPQSPPQSAHLRRDWRRFLKQAGGTSNSANFEILPNQTLGAAMTARKALKTGLPAIILTAIAILPQADNASTAIAQERPRGIALSLIPEVRGIQLCDPLFFK